MSVDEDDAVTIGHREVDPSDWVMVRALTDEEPMLAERGTKDPAVRRWLKAHGVRDAMVVAFPAVERAGRHRERDRPAR